MKVAGLQPLRSIDVLSPLSSYCFDEALVPSSNLDLRFVNAVERFGEFLLTQDRLD